MGRRTVAKSVLYFVWNIVLSGNSLQTISSKQSYSCYKLNGEPTCLSKDTNPNRQYATITTYRNQRRPDPIPDFHVDQNCERLYINLIIRHTTRYPEKKQIDKLRNDLPRLKQLILQADEQQKTVLCQEDIQRLKSFSWNNLNESIAMFATEDGKRDAREIGAMYKRKFPEIFDHPYDPSRFRFDYSGQERTLKTAQYLAKGIFGDKTADGIEYHVDKRTLYFSPECDEHQDNCGQHLADRSEERKFNNGTIMTSLLESISKRIGVTVSYDDLYNIYNSCRYGDALKTEDVWCSALSNEELRVVEYAEDLKYYWQDGHGNDINRQKSTCVIPRSLTSQLEHFLNGDGKEGALIQVTHAEELKNMYTMFELFKDEMPLRSDNMCKMKNRKWRMAFISGFLSNLSFVLHKCDGHYKLLTLHNESPVTIRGCKSPLCDLEDFMKTYKPLSGNCTIKELCCKCCK